MQLLTAKSVDPSSDPEVSTSIIDLVDRMVPQYLRTMMNTPNIQVLFDFILRALTVPEIMPKRSAAHFWVCGVSLIQATETDGMYRPYSL